MKTPVVSQQNPLEPMGESGDSLNGSGRGECVIWNMERDFSELPIGFRQCAPFSRREPQVRALHRPSVRRSDDVCRRAPR